MKDKTAIMLIVLVAGLGLMATIVVGKNSPDPVHDHLAAFSAAILVVGIALVNILRILWDKK